MGTKLLSREERQASILRAAATAFARAGFAGTSMDDVSAAAGVTKLIVYRHFDSKEALYRAVLVGVGERLRDEFVAGLEAPEGERRGFVTRALLNAARENPDGFRLLVVHAAREPAFADIHRFFTEKTHAVADSMIAPMLPDPTVKAWAAPVITDYLFDGVLRWIEVGDPARDEEFVQLASDGLVGMLTAWVDDERLPADLRSSPDERPRP